MNTKQQYRRQALGRRRALHPKERTAASARIQDTLLAGLRQRHLAGHPVLVYRAMDDEVDTGRILSMRRPLIFAPVAHTHDHMQWREAGPDTLWRRGKFGIEEPAGGRLWAPSMGKAVMICPLAGFDRKGNRLGLGLGCFDRWLARYGADVAATFGLGFSCQEVPEIPVEAHDVPLDFIITECETITCRNC